MAAVAATVVEGASIVVRDLSHRYTTSDGDVAVLDGLHLDVAPGGYVALVGRSGAGKTTLLSVLGGLERPQSGTVVVGGHDLASLDGDRLAAFRRSTVGFVFQHYGLLGALTAGENVELALSLAGLGASRRRARAGQLLEAVGLADRASHRPVALSGGERQRVALARALANEPRLVLADEPTGNLDEEATARVLGLLEDIPRQRPCTVVVVTHNPAVAARASARLALVDGRLVKADA